MHCTSINLCCCLCIWHLLLYIIIKHYREFLVYLEGTPISRCMIPPSPSPCVWCMLKLLITFTSCFTIGKAHGVAGAGLGYCIVLSPLAWGYPTCEKPHVRHNSSEGHQSHVLQNLRNLEEAGTASFPKCEKGVWKLLRWQLEETYKKGGYHGRQVGGRRRVVPYDNLPHNNICT